MREIIIILFTISLTHKFLVHSQTNDKFENCVQNVSQSDSTTNSCGFAAEVNWNIPMNTSRMTTVQKCCMTWDLFNCIEKIVKNKCGFGDAKYNYTYVKSQMDLNLRKDMSVNCTKYPDLKTCISLKNNSDITTNLTEICVGKVFSNQKMRDFCANRAQNNWKFPKNAGLNDTKYTLKQKCCSLVDEFVCLEEQTISKCNTDIKVMSLMQRYAKSIGLDCSLFNANGSCLKTSEVCADRVLRNKTQTNVCQSFADQKWNKENITVTKQKCCTHFSFNECIKTAVRNQCKNFELNSTSNIFQSISDDCNDYENISKCIRSPNSTNAFTISLSLIFLSTILLLIY
jgi:hypothetical protein